MQMETNLKITITVPDGVITIEPRVGSNAETVLRNLFEQQCRPEFLQRSEPAPLPKPTRKVKKPKKGAPPKKTKEPSNTKKGSVKPSEVSDKTLCAWYREVKTSNTSHLEIVEREGLANTAQLSNMFYAAKKRGLFEAIDKELHDIEREANV